MEEQMTLEIVKKRLDRDFHDQYLIEGCLGKGGVGTVYSCQHKELDRRVAIKLLNEVEDKVSRVRFKAEARNQGMLRHPNIVEVFDYGISNETPYIVFEFLQGRNLEDFLDDHAPLPLDESLRILGDICSALTNAHDQGVLHRDLKPSNVFITSDNTVKLLDFGLAICDDDRTRLTETGHIVGTPFYMSPEQMCDSDVDNKSDLYSLGIIFCEMLTDRSVWMEKHSTHRIIADPKRISSYIKDIEKRVPPDLLHLVERLLNDNPTKRPNSAAEVINELAKVRRRVGQTVDTVASTNTINERGRRWWHAAIGGLALLSLFLLFVVFTNKEKEENIRDFSVTSTNLSIKVKAGFVKAADVSTTVYREKTGLVLAEDKKRSCTQYSFSLYPISPNEKFKILLSVKTMQSTQRREQIVSTGPLGLTTFTIGCKLRLKPVIKDDRAIILTENKTLLCYSLSQKRTLWEVDDDLGYANLAMNGDRVFLAETKRPFVQCRSLLDGARIWKREMPNYCRSSLFIADDKLLVRVHYDRAYCMRLVDGKILWQTPDIIYQNWIVVGDYCLYSSVINMVPTKVVVDIRSGEKVESTLQPAGLINFAYDIRGKKYFHQEKDGYVYETIPMMYSRKLVRTSELANSLVATEDKLYLFLSNTVEAFDTASGNRIWKSQTSLAKSDKSQLLLDRGILYLLKEKVGLLAFSATDGSPLFQLKGSFILPFATVPISDGVIFCTDSTTIGRVTYSNGIRR